MKCPSCQKEMHNGYVFERDQPIQWIPAESKPSIWKTGVAEGSVVLGGGGFWTGGYKAEAFYCKNCKIVILPVKSKAEGEIL